MTTRARLVAIFLLGLVAFQPPLLSVFSIDARVLGIPILYFYLFVAWGLLVGLVWLATKRGEELSDSPPDRHEDGGT